MASEDVLRIAVPSDSPMARSDPGDSHAVSPNSERGARAEVKLPQREQRSEVQLPEKRELERLERSQDEENQMPIVVDVVDAPASPDPIDGSGAIGARPSVHFGDPAGTPGRGARRSVHPRRGASMRWSRAVTEQEDETSVSLWMKQVSQALLMHSEVAVEIEAAPKAGTEV